MCEDTCQLCSLKDFRGYFLEQAFYLLYYIMLSFWVFYICFALHQLSCLTFLLLFLDKVQTTTCSVTRNSDILSLQQNKLTILRLAYQQKYPKTKFQEDPIYSHNHNNGSLGRVLNSPVPCISSRGSICCLNIPPPPPPHLHVSLLAGISEDSIVYAYTIKSSLH